MDITTTLLTTTAGQTEPAIITVVLMGIGIVFIGLISLIAVCKITSFFCGLGSKTATDSTVKTASPTPVNDAVITDRKQFIAAVSSVIAEELGTDVSAIRILSVKKI